MNDKTNTLETVLGRKELAVTKRDGSTELVSIRQLPIEVYPKLLNLLDDEQAALELYCDKPAGWAKTLTPQSHTELIVSAEDLNRDFFQPWVDRRLARAERLSPGITQRLLNGALTSESSSPRSASPRG